jgi:hypothetical protein
MDAALAAHLAPAALSMARPHARALLLAAAAARRNDAEPPLPAERLSTEVAAALAAVVPAELPAVAPFLFDALRRIHGPDWHGSLDPAASRAAEAARAVLVATQVTAGDDAAGRRVPDDAVGAYPAAGSASGRASAQSLRMHLFMAMLAGSTGDGDVARDLADRRSLGLANRFLRQLQVPPSIDWFAPAPDRALGGILASPAEAAQPVAAQAIAVLALCETDIALERLDSRAAAAGNGGIGGSSPAR